MDVSPAGLVEAAVPAGGVVGVYVHVPFCEQRCHYCAFNTAPLETAAQTGRYVGALLRELDLLAAAPWARALSVGTVFFGGGTPSLLGVDELAAIMDALRGRFTLVGDAEVTVECNPESVTRARLDGYRAAGMNRVSLGVQSLDDAILASLGRLHSARRAREAFAAAREAGLANVSVDLMYGLPGLGRETWRRTVDGVLDWEPEHVSAYGLSLDAGSRWGSAGVEGLPAEDAVLEQYWWLAGRAAARGYEHYEISNYARPGFRSRHNQVYWRRGEYLAAGPGACGFLGDVRYQNARALPRWRALVDEGRLPVDTAERLTAGQAEAERLFLGLRLTDGVPGAWLAERLAGQPRLARRLEAWRTAGLLVDADGRARLTEAGFLLSDDLFSEVL